MDRLMLREALELTIQARDRLVAALGDEASPPNAGSAAERWAEDDAAFLKRMRPYIEWGPEYADKDGNWGSPPPPKYASDVKRALKMAAAYVRLIAPLHGRAKNVTEVHHHPGNVPSLHLDALVEAASAAMRNRGETIPLEPQAVDTQSLAEEFCRWPLPEGACADQCACDGQYAFPRSGTNLLTVDQAKQFFDHCFAQGLLSSRPARGHDEAIKAICDSHGIPSAGAGGSYSTAMRVAFLADRAVGNLTPYDHIRRADALLHAAYDTPCEPGDEGWHKQQAHGLIHDAAAHLSPRADARAAVRKEAEDRKRALVIEGLERASELVGGAAWRHEGEDAHSQGMDAGARHQVGECVKAISAEIASLRDAPNPAAQEPLR